MDLAKLDDPMLGRIQYHAEKQAGATPDVKRGPVMVSNTPEVPSVAVPDDSEYDLPPDTVGCYAREGSGWRRLA